MIRFNVNEERLNFQINELMSQLNNIPNKQNKANISRAIGSITAKEFVNSLNKTARSNPSQFHHLYEWKEVGKDSARLVTAKRSISGDNIHIDLSFKKSKKAVPVARALLTPGKTGKSVVRKSVFKNKAEFIENGRSANWTASRNVVFMSNGSMIFKRKGTVFNVSAPGGRAAKGGLQRYAKRWQNGMAASAVDKSRLFPKLEKDIAKTLSMSTSSSGEIRACIKKICDMYDAGSREF